MLQAGLALVPDHVAQAQLRQRVVLREDPQLVLCAVYERPAGRGVLMSGLRARLLEQCVSKMLVHRGNRLMRGLKSTTELSLIDYDRLLRKILSNGFQGSLGKGHKA